MAANASVNGNVTESYMVGNCNKKEKLWYVFFLSSVFTLIAGVLLVLFGKLVVAIHKRVSRRRADTLKKDNDIHSSKEKAIDKDGQSDIGWLTAAKDWAGELISGQTTSGRILVSLLSYSNL